MPSRALFLTDTFASVPLARNRPTVPAFERSASNTKLGVVFKPTFPLASTNKRPVPLVEMAS